MNFIDKSWISAHIYFDSNIYSYDCDLAILRLLVPFISDNERTKLFEKYFFIRYSDPYPHIRVRFFGNTNQLSKILIPVFEKTVNKNIPSLISKLQNNNNGRIIDESKFKISWIPYEPEINRYGGDDAIIIAEEYFFFSSITAISLIDSLDFQNKSVRLGMGLTLMIILLYRFIPDKQKTLGFVQNYSSSFLKSIIKEEQYHQAWVDTFDAGYNTQSDKLIEIVDNVWRALEEQLELPEVLAKFSTSLELITVQLKGLYEEKKISFQKQISSNWDLCIYPILSSYMHMMNNRLGINTQEESYLAHLIFKGIDSIAMTPNH